MDKLKFTLKHEGKLKGMISLNTSSLDNKFCIGQVKKKVPKVICKKCYSNRFLSFRPTAREAFKANGKILSENKLEKIPKINAAHVRFNSFGELINATHFYNLLLICNENKNTTFTLWTKKKNLVTKMLGQYVRPGNLILIYSSEKIGVQEKLPKFFDKVFTAYEKGTNEKLNCTEKCFDCLLCYTKNKTVYVKEEVR